MIKILNRLFVKHSLTRLNSKTINYPTQVQIEPTNGCNLKCIMCMRTTDKEKDILKDMSIDEFIRILDQIPTLERIQLNGLGEPLLNKDIVKMIKEAKKRNIFVIITTNGTVLNKKLIKELVEGGLDCLKISLDSPIKEKYKTIRGFDLDKVIENLKELIKEKGRVNAKLKVGLNSILMRNNIDDIEKFYKLADSIGLDFIYFKRLNESGLKAGNYGGRFEEHFIRRVKEAFNFLPKYKVKSTLKSIFGFYQKAEKCYSPWYECYISSKGDIKLCCEFYHDNTLIMGNIFKENFKRIWNNEKYIQVRKLAKDKKLIDNVCKGCNLNFRNYHIEKKIDRFKKNKFFGLFIK